MNKYLKVLVINTILFVSLIFSFQSNISYSQSNNIDTLISITKKKEYLNKRINDLDYILKNKKQYAVFDNNMKSSLLEKKISVDSIKYSQIKFFKVYFEKQLINCEKSKNFLIKEIKEEKKEALENSNATYIKGKWPLENYRYISSGYGYRTHPITKRVSFHNGIDICLRQKYVSVLASDDGIVTFSGYKSGYGNVVEIKHLTIKKPCMLTIIV